MIAVLAVAALMVGAATAGAITWSGPPQTLDTSELGVGGPVLVGPDGTVTAVWLNQREIPVEGDQTLAGGTVRVATRPPGGVFSPPTNLADGPILDADAAIGPNGAVTVVWNTGSAIQATTRLPGGTFGAPEQVASGATQSSFINSLSLAVGPAGTSTVVWFESETILAPPFGEQLRIRASTRAAGQSFGAPVLLDSFTSTSSGSFLSPRVDIGADGTTVAAWSYRVDSDPAVVRQATRPPGGSFGAATLVGQQTGGVAPFDLVVAADGSAGLIWGAGGGGNEIQLSLRPAGGSFQAPVPLGQSGPSTLVPALGSARDGSLVAIWPDATTLMQGVKLPGATALSSIASVPGTSVTGLASFDLAVARGGSAVALLAPKGGGALQQSLRAPGGSFGAPTDSGFDPRAGQAGVNAAFGENGTFAALAGSFPVTGTTSLLVVRVSDGGSTGTSPLTPPAPIAPCAAKVGAAKVLCAAAQRQAAALRACAARPARTRSLCRATAQRRFAIAKAKLAKSKALARCARQPAQRRAACRVAAATRFRVVLAKATRKQALARCSTLEDMRARSCRLAATKAYTSSIRAGRR